MKALKLTQEGNSQLSDSEIIRRVVAGEKELYELLMRRNNQKLYRILRGYLRQPNEIEDAMQDTYLKAFEKLYQFKDNSAFSTWLIRIGINEALNRIKRKGKFAFINSNLDQSITNRSIPMQKDNQPSPEELMIQQEGNLLIEKTIDLLDAKHRVVFIMKEIEGMRIKEIAESLELTEANVKVRLHRAKSTLKEKLMEAQVKKGVFEFGFSKCDKLVSLVMKQI